MWGRDDSANGKIQTRRQDSEAIAWCPSAATRDTAVPQVSARQPANCGPIVEVLVRPVSHNVYYNVPPSRIKRDRAESPQGRYCPVGLAWTRRGPVALVASCPAPTRSVSEVMSMCSPRLRFALGCRPNLTAMLGYNRVEVGIEVLPKLDFHVAIAVANYFQFTPNRCSIA